ncbi:hypothetical protein CW368_07400 [Actinomycetales bacterium SN12]|nr:hypothetical protein CW368_07400 [Actinomycetales bacterium SN12]
MPDENAYDAAEPAEGEYTDADHGDGTTTGRHHAGHAGEVEGEYTDGVYSADGREQHLPHHGEGTYTDADHGSGHDDHSGGARAEASGAHAVEAEAHAVEADAHAVEEEGEYTDGRYPDDGDAGRADRRHS